MPEHSAGDTVLTWVGNGAAAGAVVSTMVGWLPPVAAGMAFFWYAIQIYESKTVQTWMLTRRTRKVARMKAAAAKMNAEAMILEAKTRGQLPGPGDDPDEA